MLDILFWIVLGIITTPIVVYLWVRSATLGFFRGKDLYGNIKSQNQQDNNNNDKE